MWRVAVCGAVVGALVMAGCSSTSTRFDSVKLGDTKAIVTTADLRLVTERELPNPNQTDVGRTHKVLCTEPSPDVAKALSTSSSGQFALNVSFPLSATVVTGAASGAFARATAEQLAQLTERLPTIQALRDGLYRACEAYANQAIGRNAYALILSRYGELLTTLLLAETVGGDYGRKLALLEGVALGTGKVSDLAPLPAATDTPAGHTASTPAAQQHGAAGDRAGDAAIVPVVASSAAGTPEPGTSRRPPPNKGANQGGAGAGRTSIQEQIGDHIPAAIEQMQFNYFKLNHITPLLVLCANVLDGSIPGNGNVLTQADHTSDHASFATGGSFPDATGCTGLINKVVDDELQFRKLDTPDKRKTTPGRPRH